MTRFRHAIPLLALLALGAESAAAQGFRVEDIVRADVIPGWRTAQGTHMAALHLTLAEGWKTYWRAPGDSGFPPQFDWAGSENLAGVELHWPRPEVFDTGGVRTIGFDRELVLPLEVALLDATGAARLSGTVDLGVCDTVCVPVRLELAAALPAAAGMSDARIRAALDHRPDSAAEAGLRAASCTLVATPEGMRLTATLDLPQQGMAEVAVVEVAAEGVWVSSAETRREGPRLVAEAALVSLSGAPLALDPAAVRITVLGDDQAVDIPGCAVP